MGMRIFLTGGGTAGSVTPLLAAAGQLQQHDVWFVGTRHGIERNLVPIAMRYVAIPAGKLRRYWDWRNLVDPFIIVTTFFYSLWLMARHNPNVVVSAGSFVSVPVVWAAWWCNIPVVIHQQDLQVGLATRIMRCAATATTKAFLEIPLPGAVTIGNPVRTLVPTTQQLKLDASVPTVLIFGGGTGAEAINQLVDIELCAKANVIHLTGQGKGGLHSTIVQAAPHGQRYHQFELLTETMAEALQRADVVVCRAGLGTLSELAVLGKPTIVIPIPHSHQEQNAVYFAERQAILKVEQNSLTPQRLTQQIVDLLHNSTQQAALAKAFKRCNPADAAQRLAQVIERYDLSQS